MNEHRQDCLCYAAAIRVAPNFLGARGYHPIRCPWRSGFAELGDAGFCDRALLAIHDALALLALLAGIKL